MLEAGPKGSVDPDDPEAFIRHYQNAWQRAGFEPVEITGDEDAEVTAMRFPQYEKYVWREGIFSVEVTHETPHQEGEAHVPRQFGHQGGWDIYAFINNVPDDPDARSQSAYAHKTAKTEQKALATAIRLRHEITTSMAARLVKLGFTGWRNHWHKAPITVTLKPSKSGGYANINLRMDYLPNDAAIKALTTLNKFVDKVYPDR